MTKFLDLLNTLEALDKAATRGPWDTQYRKIYNQNDEILSSTSSDCVPDQDVKNCKFIVALRNAAPQLIAVCRAAYAVDKAGVATADPYESEVLNALGDAIAEAEERL